MKYQVVPQARFESKRSGRKGSVFKKAVLV